MTKDWRESTLSEIRKLIAEADPAILEERKWAKPTNPAGVPTWTHAGIVCTGETYKNYVKLTFARGAELADPAKLFNAGLEGNVRRAIDIKEGETLDGKAFKALIKAAVKANVDAGEGKKTSTKSGGKKRSGATVGTPPVPTGDAQPHGRRTDRGARKKPLKTPEEDGVALLSGGNPQIAKADGDEPVQTFINAMPGWKQAVGRRLDDLIVKAVPNVRKAVRWNTPFYGVKPDGGNGGWFLGFHCMTKYVKVAFFKGSSLKPLPPGQSKQKDVRYLDIYEDNKVTDEQLTDWIKQAAALPGEKLF